MFEDFDEKSVRALEAAKELATRLEDESVATGHVIYGLTVDESTALHHIFKDLNVDPDMFSGYVESLPREPAMNGEEPWNRHVKTAIERASATREELGGPKVTPEYLCLALLSIRAGSCYETLREFSIDPGYVTRLIMQSMGREPDTAPEWF